MRFLAIALLVFWLAGCGVLDDEGPAIPRGPDPAVYGPTEPEPPDAAAAGIDPPPVRAPSRAVARSLDGGAIGVVDVTGAVGVRPPVVETADDMRVEHVTWSRWGASGAEGRGEARWLDCQPTCANGREEAVPAKITLSGVRVCSGRQYFSSATVAIARPPGGEPPATYVRAPC